NKVEKISDNDYKVWLNVMPIEGKANKLLIKLLSKFLKVPMNKISIFAGSRNKNKIITIDKT
ncbi:hypothetical protein A2533_00120, partial [Candidatus Falkowbacteria bacterium RIFOXYD2_FULL_35_9]